MARKEPSIESEILELNETRPLADGEIDQFQRQDGPLVVGLDVNNEPVARTGGTIGNLLILGEQEPALKLDNSILRAFQIIAPECDPPHSVVYETESEYRKMLDKHGKDKSELIDRAATKGVTVPSIKEGIRFFGPAALKSQIELALSTMNENWDFLRKHDLDVVPVDMMHTLHISGLDKLAPQNDRDGIYSMLGELAMGDSMGAGVYIIISASNSGSITKTLKDNIIIVSLRQNSERASRSVIGRSGMEVAFNHVGAIETRNDGIETFRF